MTQHTTHECKKTHTEQGHKRTSCTCTHCSCNGKEHHDDDCEYCDNDCQDCCLCNCNAEIEEEM